MADLTSRRHLDLEPTHPGEILRDEVLPGLDMPVATAAQQLGVSRQTVDRILAGTTSLSPEMAVRIGRFCGNGLQLRMQAAYDLWHAERTVDVSAIPAHRVVA